MSFEAQAVYEILRVAGSATRMFPARRLRRLRYTPGMRRLIRESRVTVDDLVCPIFVEEGLEYRKQVGSMTGIERIPLSMVNQDVRAVHDMGIPAVMLFGIPSVKDEVGSSSYDDDGIVQKSIVEAKKAASDMVIMADVCMCQYTSTGHCGIYRNGSVDNDATLSHLVDIAVSYAKRGVDVLSPSAMMDGQVAAIRAGLDKEGFENVAIMPHSAKHRSIFYTPFRDAASCTPQSGDRKGYQIPYTNGREAMAEVQADVQEGADIIMIKPALAYLDLVAEVRRRFDIPVAAYNVSGEYALVQAAHQKGWLDRTQVALEILSSIKRAGADIIITYFAKDIAEHLAGTQAPADA